MPVFRVSFTQYYTTFDRLTLDVEAPDEASLQAALEDDSFDVNEVAEKAGTTWDEYHTEQDNSPTLEGISEFPADSPVKPAITLDGIKAINAGNSTETEDEPAPVQ